MKLAMGLLFFLVTWTSPVFGESGCKQIFRVGGNNFDPLYYATDDKRYAGIVADLIQEIKRRTQCGFKVEPMNRARVLRALKLSQIDLIIGAVKNSTFDEYAEFIPLYETQREVVVWGAIEPQNRSIEKLMANPIYKFLGVPTTTPFLQKDEIDVLMSQHRLIYTPNEVSHFAVMARGKSMVIVGVDFINTIGLKKENIEEKVTRFYDLIGPRIQAGVYYLPSRVSVKEVNLILESLKSIRNDGTLRKIINKHVPGEFLIL